MRKCILALLLLLTACGSSTDLDDKWANPEAITYAASLGVDLSKMNTLQVKSNDKLHALYWTDMQVGVGDTAKVGDEVRVHLTVFLPDGTPLATTRDSGPAEFLLGLGFVMPGIDGGVIGMRVGGTRKLVVRPELARGLSGPPPGIPARTTIVIDVERLTTAAH